MRELGLFHAGTDAGTAGTDALAYLRSIYRNPREPTSVRMRAAIAALAFENPKFGIIAHVDNLFGERMEAALARSAVVRQIEAKPVEAKPAWRRV